MTEEEKKAAEELAKKKAAEELAKEQAKETMFDMADLADVIKETVASTVKDSVPAMVAEAVKPFTEKSETSAKYADAIIEMERKKQELNTPKAEKGCTFARYARLKALGKGDWERGVREARQRNAWGPDDPVVQAVEKALTASDADQAGGIILPAVAAEFIELLRAQATVRSIARVLPMPNGSLEFRKQTAAATASYTGESAAVNASQQTVGNVTLSFKKLVTITAVSNSLLRFASPDADQMVRDDLLQVMALREDLAFLTGDGESSTPMGILNRVNSANKFDDGGTTYAQQKADYTKAIRLIEAANVPLTPETGHWIMHPQPFWGIYATTGSTEDATSPFQAALNLNPPQMLGFEVKKSTQPGTTKIYFAHGPSLLVGDSMNIELTAMDGAAYVDSSGTMVSGTSRDETVIKAVSEHDFNMRHDLAAAVIETVTVGA